MSARIRLSRAARWALAALLAVWFAIPFAPMLLRAFAKREQQAWFPLHWDAAAAVTAFEHGGAEAFGRSVLLGLLVAAIATPAGAIAGRTLALGQAPAPRTLTAILFAPLLLPPLAAALGMNVLLLRAHVPELAGLVLVLAALATPYTTFSMRVAYAAYDLGYDEEARLLGASGLQTLRRIQLPLIAPALGRSAFLAFLVGWSDYVVTVLIGGGQIVTLPLVAASAATGVGNDSMVAVLSLAAVVPPVVLLVLLARTPWQTGGRT